MNSNNVCEQCGASFTVRKSLLRHQKSLHQNILHKCNACGKDFSRSDTLSRHLKVNCKKTKREEVNKNDIGPSTNKRSRIEEIVNKYNLMYGSQYIELPNFIKKKKAIINVKSKDNRSFQWAVLSALHPDVSNPCRHSSFTRFVGELDFTGIEFPVKLNSIITFEKMNEISVNVYGLTECYKVIPLIITKVEKDKHVDLLYLTMSGKIHYCWIKNLSRLVSSQISGHHGYIYICQYCLSHFGKEEIFEKHIIVCKEQNPLQMEISKNQSLKFKNFQKPLEVPLFVNEV